MREVEVVSYNRNWERLFEEEAEKLKKALGENLIDIHHIGSTSVPGLSAKPIIDIMPVVASIDRVDERGTEMKALGYEPMGEYGIPGRRYFRKGRKKRTHHVHIFEREDSNILRHLAFRDYLREHRDVKEHYGELKKRLAEQYPNELESYIKGKDAFVKLTEQKALAWQKNCGPQT